MFKMDFEEFCIQSKKIKLLRKEDSLKLYALENNLSLTMEEFDKSVALHGLYFPNDQEISNICTEFNNVYRMGGSFMDLPRTRDFKDYFSAFFMSLLKRELNMNFEENYFFKAEEFLKSASTEGLHLKKNVDILTNILGESFEKARLFDSEIRIKALRISPRINVINEFERIQIGYIGDVYALPKKED